MEKTNDYNIICLLSIRQFACVSLTLSQRSSPFTHPALKVHLGTEGDQRLDALHLGDAVITLLNQLEQRRVKACWREQSKESD